MVEIQFIDVGRKANQLTLDTQNKLLTSIPTETSQSLDCVTSDTKNNVLAVGWSGTILKYDATQDKFVLHPQSGSITTEDLHYIDTSVGNGVAVGDKFTVLYYDSSTETFSLHALNGYDTNVNLYGAYPVRTVYGTLLDFYWGKDTTNNHGVLYIYDGTTITKVIDTNKGAIHGFFTLNLKDCLAIGYGGGIYKSTDYGYTWTEVETDVTDNFFTVYGLSYDEIWIGTTNGKIYKYNFNTDKLKLIASGYTMVTCIGGSAKNDLYAVGGAGLFLHFDGKRWEQLPSGTIAGLNFIMVVEENKIYVVGANGTAYRFYGKAYPSVLIDNTGETIGTIAKPLHSAIKGYYPASGDYRPIAVNASGEISIHATVADIVTAKISGETVLISGQPVTVISGQLDITTDISGQPVTISGDIVKAEQYGAWGVQVSGAVIVSGDLAATVSGNIVRSEQYGTWGVQVSGAVQVSGEVVAHVSGETVIARTIATTMSTSVYTVTAASGGTQIATQNTDRKSLLVQNIGTGDIYLKESALQSGEGIKILAGGSYTTNTYVGDLWAYATTSGDKVVVNEEA